jgi:hypothetical protein
MNEQTGPLFKIISSCEGCKYLFKVDNVTSPLGSNNHCKILNKCLHFSLTPLSDCPFELDLEIKFHENIMRKLKEQEFQKLEKIIMGIFSGFDYSINEYSGEIYFKSEDEIYLNQLKEFEKKFPDYDLEIDSYDSDTIQIRISK